MYSGPPCERPLKGISQSGRSEGVVSVKGYSNIALKTNVSSN